MNQNTNVNLVPRFPFSGNLYFSQYDVGRVATINLVEDGTAYTIPSGATVKIQATKPSGLGFSVDCTYSGSVVTVVSTETMTNEYGRFPCELRIESGDVLLGTTNFTFNVEKSPHPTNTVDGDSGDIINQITVALNNALSDIEDAKEEAIEEISQSGGGISQAVKVALLNCFSHVAWIDANGQTYYDALYDALYDVPAPTLTSISAVYTQSGTVYTTDTLDSLKSDLVVTATYSDSSTATVPSADYTLSGTLTEGTSTITVTYEGLTATFNVTVSTLGWTYTPSMGLLKNQPFINDFTQGTLTWTEEVIDDYLHITSPGNTGDSSYQLFQFIPQTFAGTKASIKFQIRVNDLPYVAQSNTSAAGIIRFRLSNGTNGAQFGLCRNQSATGDIIIRYVVGSTATPVTSYPLSAGWHTIEGIAENGKQTIKLDDVEVVSNANLSTSYTTANQMLLFGNGRTANTIDIDIKLIEYKEIS